jgi:ribosomal protein S18 acetylase RimI-like enzyme
MADVCIREFQLDEDYDSALRLWSGIEKGIHIGPSDAPAELRKKLQRDPDLFLVAEADGALVGTVIAGFDGRRGFVYHLAVDQRHRNEGIGGRLMDEVESRLRGKGCIRCYLFVTSDNLEAMRFYERRGWLLMDNLPYAKDLVS